MTDVSDRHFKTSRTSDTPQTNGVSPVPETLSFEDASAKFQESLQAKNRSPLTVRAYATDLAQFFSWLRANNMVATTPDRIERADIIEYLSSLGQRQLSGVTRARKLAAVREFFRFLENNDYIRKSPAQSVEAPKKEKNTRVYLRPDEYHSMLAQAGSNPRDYAILQLFLQTGIRVSELCDLSLVDIDFAGRTVKVRGKGMVERNIEMERKGLEAIKNYLATRLPTVEDRIFLNKDGTPLGQRGVRKMVRKYRLLAGITKRASPHSLRHTFATYKAERGVSPFQLQQWLGHANINTTQIYVHMSRQNAKKVMEATSL